MVMRLSDGRLYKIILYIFFLNEYLSGFFYYIGV